MSYLVLALVGPEHLDVLSDAGLVARTKSGRTVSVELVAGPMEEAMEWLSRYERFWSARSTAKRTTAAANTARSKWIGSSSSPGNGSPCPMPERRSLVTIELRPVSDGAELTFTHAQFFDEAARDGHYAGWNTAFDKLEVLLAQTERTDHGTA